MYVNYFLLLANLAKFISGITSTKIRQDPSILNPGILVLHSLNVSPLQFKIFFLFQPFKTFYDSFLRPTCQISHAERIKGSVTIITQILVLLTHSTKFQKKYPKIDTIKITILLSIPNILKLGSFSHTQKSSHSKLSRLRSLSKSQTLTKLKKI